MGGEKMSGVSTQGLGGSGEKEPIVLAVLVGVVLASVGEEPGRYWGCLAWPQLRYWV
jgi:hypothetical protein